MFQGLTSSFNMVKQSISVFKKYPKLLIPLVFSWGIFILAALFFEFKLKIANYTFNSIALTFLTLIFIFSLSVCMSASVLLELIEHIEIGEVPSFSKALSDTFLRNLLRILPVAFIWSILWAGIIIVFIFGKSVNRRRNLSNIFTAEDILNAHVVNTNGVPFSLLDLFNKGIRMVAFLILPSIAWEDKNAYQSTKRGFYVLKTHFNEFVSGFALTEIVTLVLFVPLIIILLFFQSTFSSVAWFAIIVYYLLAISFSMYIEQMFTSLLFMWHKKWEDAVEAAELENRVPPKFTDIKEPSLLDDVPDLIPQKYRRSTLNL